MFYPTLFFFIFPNEVFKSLLLGRVSLQLPSPPSRCHNRTFVVTTPEEPIEPGEGIHLMWRRRQSTARRS